MNRIILLIFMIIYGLGVFGQDNCNVFLWQGDTCKYEACHYLEEAQSWFQLTKQYHEIKDEAIAICPTYATPYKHKSTAYLKTGDFIGFKKLIDKAVELNPLENLAYRGWCRFQFFRDYKGAIKDIEALEVLTNGDIGYCQNGDYHLVVAKALCYKMIGNTSKAISLIKEQIRLDTASAGMYDYLHLGVLYMEESRHEDALICFEKQMKVTDLAENQYYKALNYRAMGNISMFKESLQKAEDLYHNSTYMYDIYTEPIDKIYLKDIELEMETR